MSASDQHSALRRFLPVRRCFGALWRRHPTGALRTARRTELGFTTPTWDDLKTLIQVDAGK